MRSNELFHVKYFILKFLPGLLLDVGAYMTPLLLAAIFFCSSGRNKRHVRERERVGEEEKWEIYTAVLRCS